MKVAVVHSSLNFCGGAERVCLSFVRVLSEAGLNVTLFTVDRPDWDLLAGVFSDFSDLRFEERFILARIPRSLGPSIRKILVALFFIPLVFFVKFFRKFDLVIVTSGELVDSIGDVIYVNALPLRLMHRFPDNYAGWAPYWRCLSKLHDLFLRVVSIFNPRRLILANSRFNGDIIEKVLGGRTLVLHPPVETAKFMCSSDNVLNRSNLVITVSRIHPGKSLENVLKVAERIDSHDARFLIVGSGDMRFGEILKNHIRALKIDDRIEIFFNLPRENIVGLMSSAKIFLHTQRFESFGMAIVEAMAAGCVPVVPRASGSWTDVLGGAQGVYGFSYSTIDEARDIIKRLLDDEKLRESIAVRARKRALTFDFSVFRFKVLRIVKCLCEKV